MNTTTWDMMNALFPFELKISLVYDETMRKIC